VTKEADQRRFSRDFKLGVLSRMAAGENVSALSRELGIARKCLYQWRDRFRLGGAVALRSRGRPTKAECEADAAAG
jgi:transposase-like protein